MEQHLFSLRTMEDADRLHQGAAAAGPVPRPRVIDVAGVKAERAVVAVPAAGNGRADKGPAAAALERFLPIRPPLLATGWLPGVSGCETGLEIAGSRPARSTALAVVRGNVEVTIEIQVV